MSSMSVLGVLAKSRTAPTSSPIGSEKPAAPRHRGSVPSAIVKSIRGASFRPSLVVFSSKPMTATESAPPSTITANPIYDAYKQARLEVLRMEATWQLLLDRGCTASQFNLSLSWRETRGREQTCFSVRGKHAGQDFALQVQSARVRNVIVDNLNMFLNHVQGDVDGDFSKAMRVKIAQHFAATGEVLSIQEVRTLLHRQGSDTSKLHPCPPSQTTFASRFDSDSDDSDTSTP
ncbi:hypothetical protein B5M09_013075 [Aphanomyces astaci]|uniref:Uncharacterized protein n=1 Tax=Aphanomyces astaci TaxID=112090 RepID=A0A3R7YXU9_APHAT|nr:hypothetical protein B5M09_013075 [Aphanomyces astaci]